MNHLVLENFKAFHQSFVLECLNDENVLIYGENGSGKTSIFDAFRLFYFKRKLFDELIPANVVEGREEEEDAIVNSFSFDKTNNPMVLSIDGVDHIAYDSTTEDQVFLLSYNDLHPQKIEDDHICIKQMLRHAFFKFEKAIDNWYDSAAERYIVDNVNRILKDVFYIYDLNLSVSQTGDDICTLEYTDKIDKKNECLSRYYNEATLHLVRFIVLMECISFIRNKNKPSLLVLDDCFNSLDAPNRSFIMRYLLKETDGMQKIILTHNLSYYNLMSHLVSTEYGSEKWLKKILYIIDGHYELKPSELTGGVDKIINNRKNNYYADSIQLGNAIRQEFEVLVYRLSMLCNIGTMSESRNILDLMCNSNNCNVYLSVDGNNNIKTAATLVDEIYRNVTNGNYFNLQGRLKDKIEEYRANDIIKPLLPTLVELRLLQKVALHQASHGHFGLPPVQSKEFDVCIALLKKIETAVSSINNVDISTI